MNVPTRSCSGFTLVELLVVFVVLTLLVTVAVPGGHSLVAYGHQSSATQNLLAALRYARAESINQSSSMQVCQSNAAATACRTTPTLNWLETGWLVHNRDTGVVLRVWPPLDSRYVTLTRDKAMNSSVVFLRDGRVVPDSHQPGFSLMNVRDANNPVHKKSITLSLSGRVTEENRS